MPEDKKQTIKVTVIEVQKQSALVEYKTRAGLKRVIIPASEVHGQSVDVGVLDAGIEYGIPWEKLIKITQTPAICTEALHIAGIWTPEDVFQKQKEVRGAINAVSDIEFSKLLQIATAYQEEVKHA